ncbi:hypothetical protein N7495_007396 [Penicillium taxi]|uniref:uncharacterized protein n=1 Tax=Penicillium taxi TaxID=168475 RepID=UPI0025456C43|nr:uncharacterized protein N7495_007396 [Penicillium taxi]KAJ5887355.1 hypothetical protein N7495_007396 [Penicillium taxi]
MALTSFGSPYRCIQIVRAHRSHNRRPEFAGINSASHAYGTLSQTMIIAPKTTNRISIVCGISAIGQHHCSVPSRVTDWMRRDRRGRRRRQQRGGSATPGAVQCKFRDLIAQRAASQAERDVDSFVVKFKVVSTGEERATRNHMVRLWPGSPRCFCSRERLHGVVANIGQNDLGVG